LREPNVALKPGLNSQAVQREAGAEVGDPGVPALLGQALLAGVDPASSASLDELALLRPERDPRTLGALLDPKLMKGLRAGGGSLPALTPITERTGALSVALPLGPQKFEPGKRLKKR
jgi:hypothetical protein